MSTHSFGSLIVALNVAPALEERVVDWLLEREEDAGFTSYVANGHSSDHGHLSVAEQVSGRQRRLEFRIELPADSLDTFVGGLKAAFGGADVYFVVTPVIRSGHLRETAS